MELVGAAKKRILEALVHAPPDGWTLSEIAAQLGRKSPPVFMHLKELRQGGIIDRLDAETGNPRYRVRRFLHVTYVSPTNGQFTEWETNEPVSWRFPLVSRVPDPAAQDVLRRFLPQFEDRYFELLEQKGAKSIPVLSHVRPEDAISFTVFGSSARGQAREGSDLDLLLLEPRNGGVEKAARELVGEANLWARRKIDLRVLKRNAFLRLEGQLQAALRKDGILVYTTDLAGPLKDPALEGNA